MTILQFIAPLKYPRMWCAQFTANDDGAKKLVVPAGANGSIVDAMALSSDDVTTPYAVQFYVNDGTTDFLFGTVELLVAAGAQIAAPGVDVLRSGMFGGSPLDGGPYLRLGSGFSIKFRSTTLVAAGKTLTCIAQGGDYP